MLVRLYGENFRSFRDPFELSLVATDLTNKQDSDRGFAEVPIDGQDEPLRLLRCAAIYGPNASGKSTLLIAAHALLYLIQRTSRELSPEKSIPPYEPFVLDETAKDLPVRLGCTITHDGTLYEYEIQYRANNIEFERLDKITGKMVSLFERNGDQPVSGELIEQSDAVKLYVEDMQPNVSVLSKLAHHGPSKGPGSVIPYYKALLSSLHSRDYTYSTNKEFGFSDPVTKKFKEDDDFREWAMDHLIRPADLGIVDVNVNTIPVPESVREKFASFTEDDLPSEFNTVSFVHQGNTNESIDFEAESAGTRKLFRLSVEWWKFASQESTLFADELSASLHPKLLDVLVRAINDATAGPGKNSQLILTTHDTGLLEARDGKPPALRRDQVYFTEKGTDGASRLYPLTEFRDKDRRDVHNIRKRYHSGLYGAMPLVERFSL